MNANKVNNGRGYWLAWFLASVMGYGFGAVLGESFSSAFYPENPFYTVITWGFVMGATGGYFQWVVLRERIAGAGLWALASALGLGLAMGTVIAADAGENFAVAGLLMAAIFGLTSGVFQWLILRRKVQRAGWWLPATIAGSFLGAIGVPVAGMIFDAGNWELGVLTFGLLFGVANGAITGAVLTWLLRQASTDETEGLATVH